MSIRRITISVPETVARRIKRAAGSTPVSSWVTDVIEAHLDDAELDRLWEEFCRDVSPSAKDARRADAIFKRLTAGGRGRAA
jgi:hypothetical protein